MLSWDAPLGLVLLVLLVPMGLALWRALVQLRARRDRYADPELLGRMARLPREASEAMRLGILLMAFALAAIALAGPRWGASLQGRLAGEVPSLVVACDVSRSMGVQDGSPTRLEAARDTINGLLDNLTGWRTGLIAFADDAQVFCPMTSDTAAVETLTARLKPGMSELKPGTNVEAAITKALSQLEGRPGAILLVSDGEALSGNASLAAQAAAKVGVPIFTAVVGTPDGGQIPTGTDLFGQPTYRMGKDGAPVISHSDATSLEALAKATGGRFVAASQTGASEQVLAALRQRWAGDGNGREGIPLYQLPLALAILLLLTDGIYSRRAGLRRLIRFKPLVGMYVALFGLSQQAFTWPWTGLGAVRSASSAYQHGQWDQAQKDLGQAIAQHPDDWHIAYDLGCVRYQAGNFEGAAQAFSSALDHLKGGDRSGAWIQYNLGNALFRQGEAKGDRRARWSEAVSHYQAALKLDPQDADARYNLDLVTRRLKELPPEKPKGGGKQEHQGAPKEPNQDGQGLPNDAEIQATLDALQHEERQHQAEQAPQVPTPPPVSASDLLKQLVNQAANHEALSDRPDW